ncbi:MAG: TolB family protein [Pirellulales bacterium]
MKRSCRWLLVVLLLGCLPGCVPEDLVWFPDSSGFVYSQSDSAVVRFDLASRTRRVVVAEDWLRNAGQGRPAISPDGKQMALVRSTTSRDVQLVEILTYDLAGKPAGPPRRFTWPGDALSHVESKTTLGWAFWSPDGQRLLVYVESPPADKAATAVSALGLLDLATGVMARYGDLELPWECVLFGPSLFTPDGQGFLAARAKPNRDFLESLVVVAWNGSVQDLKSTPEVLEARDRIRDPLRVWPWAEWEQGVAFANLHQGRAVLDPIHRMVTLDPDGAARRLWDYAAAEKVQVGAVLAGGLMVQTRSLKDAGRNVARIELAGLATQPKPLVEMADAYDALFSVSPDRHCAVVCYHDVRDRKEHLLIVDFHGDVLADFPR